MYASPHDYVSYSIFFFGEYDSNMTNFMKAHIFEGNVSWDLGTERGWFTLLMANLVGSMGRVDSFEAFPPNFKKLQKNIELNNFSWVHFNNIAISDKTSKMYFVPPSDEITNYVSFLQDNSGVGYLTDRMTEKSLEIRTTSIDEYVEQHPVERLDMMKIDIEGAELSAILGAKHTLEKFRPKIVIEYNQISAKRAGTSIEELDDLLDSCGYDRFTFSGKLRKLKIENWKNRPDDEVVLNVYCFPRTKYGYYL